MKYLIEEKLNPQPPPGETKLKHLTNELVRVIQTELNEGDALPSVNSMSNSLNFSRDTVFKVYQELKKQKIVDSTPTKGYYVNKSVSKVLLLLDYYSPFKDLIYKELKMNLGDAYTIDLVFHHYNQQLFDSVIQESANRYSSYLVMNIDTQKLKISSVLHKLDPSRVMFLDIPIEDWHDFDSTKYSFVWQDFDKSVYHSLESISTQLCKYKNFYFVNPEHLKHPSITMNAFHRFCSNYGLEQSVIRSFPEVEVQKGNAYFILRQDDLADALKQIQLRELEIGKDVGLLIYNDSPLYEFIDKGLTVISTDFREIGRKAARFINNDEIMHELVPTSVTIRNSI